MKIMSEQCFETLKSAIKMLSIGMIKTVQEEFFSLLMQIIF